VDLHVFPTSGYAVLVTVVVSEVKANFLRYDRALFRTKWSFTLFSKQAGSRTSAGVAVMAATAARACRASGLGGFWLVRRWHWGLCPPRPRVVCFHREERYFMVPHRWMERALETWSTLLLAPLAWLGRPCAAECICYLGGHVHEEPETSEWQKLA